MPQPCSKYLGLGAALNLGDIYAYALARRLGCPLLFVGADFSLTDVAAAG